MILACDFRSRVGRWNRDFGPLNLFTKHLRGVECVSGRSKSQFCFKSNCFFNDFGFTAIPEASRSLQRLREALGASRRPVPWVCLPNISGATTACLDALGVHRTHSCLVFILFTISSFSSLQKPPGTGRRDPVSGSRLVVSWPAIVAGHVPSCPAQLPSPAAHPRRIQ